MKTVMFVQSSPSPRPSPSGRGGAMRRVLIVRKPGDEVLSYRMKAARVSPSPGGAGRGEGGRQSNFIHLYIRQHPLIRLLTSAATRATA